LTKFHHYQFEETCHSRHEPNKTEDRMPRTAGLRQTTPRYLPTQKKTLPLTKTEANQFRNPWKTCSEVLNKSGILHSLLRRAMREMGDVESFPTY